MDKLLFLGKVIDLYAEDYQRLQDTIDSNLKTLFRVTVNNPDEPAIIRGFNLTINSTDPTKVDIYHVSSPGAIVNGDNEVVETDKTYISYALPSYTDNQVYRIYAKVTKSYKSFDPQTGTYLTQPKRLDLATYTYVYDTEVYDYEPAIYTIDEYNALTAEEKKNLVVLGAVTAHGDGQPLTDLDLDIRVYSAARQTSGAITEENISDSIRMPQYWVRSTSATPGVSENDNFSGTKQTLVDDLNDLRTHIRKIKGTLTYQDDASGSLANLDPLADNLHVSGIDYQSANALKVVPKLSFTVKVTSGKCLISGKVVTATATPEVTVTLSPSELTLVEEQEHSTYLIPSPEEDPSMPGWTYPVTLLNNASTGAIIGPPEGYVKPRVWENRGGTWWELNSDQILYYPEGQVRFDTAAVEGGNYFKITYRYGYTRYDLIYANSQNQFLSVQGTYTNSSNTTPIIPNPPDNNCLLLGAVKLYPFQSSISTSDIVDLRVFLQPVRDIIALQSNSYIQEKIFKPNSFVYLSPSEVTENPTNPAASWKLELVDGEYRCSSKQASCIMYGYMYFPENSELWLLREKNYQTTTITLYFQDNPTQDTLTSSVITLDKLTTASQGPYLQKVKSGITRGYHKFIIVTSTLPFGLYGVVAGNLSVFYKGLQASGSGETSSKVVLFDSLQATIQVDDNRKGTILIEPTSSSTYKHFCKSSGDYLERVDCESVYPIARRCAGRLTTASNTYAVPFGTTPTETSDHMLSINVSTSFGSTVKLKWVRFKFTDRGETNKTFLVILHDSSNNAVIQKTCNTNDIILNDYTYIELDNIEIFTGVSYHFHIIRNQVSGVSTLLQSNVTNNFNTALFALYNTPLGGLYPTSDSIRFYKLDGTLLIPETQSLDNALVGNVPPDERMLFPMAVDFSNTSIWDSWDYENGYAVGIDYITGRIKFSTLAFNLVNT